MTENAAVHGNKEAVVSVKLNKKLSYRRGTARCVVSVEILPVATQQCSTTSSEQSEVMNLGGLRARRADV